MRLTTGAITGIGMMMATLMPAQVAADANIYAYATSANFCPAGLQPITISGVICCGTPNQPMTYQQALAHPVKRHYVAKRKHYKARSARANCPIGTKGCTYD